MSFTIQGASITGGSRDEDGYTDYKITWLLRGDIGDGPANAFQCPGIPQPGSQWDTGSFGFPSGADTDSSVWCHWDSSVKPVVSNEPGNWYNLDQRFSSKPEKRCRTNPVEDPLLEPPVITGNFAKYTEEAVYDRFGIPITNSAHEQIRGPQNEWDKNRISVKIVTNVATARLGYALPAAFMDHVNSLPMWGLGPRQVKLSAAPWELKFNGPCATYYKRTLDFDIRPETFDRDLLDEATKVLGGADSHWDLSTGSWVASPILGYSGSPNPDPVNPTHFTRFIDRKGNPIKGVLNGHGIPYEPELVSTCSQCSSGSPKIWVMTGAAGAELSYQSGCTWVGNDTNSDDVFTLTYDAVILTWRLTNLGGDEWLLSATEWSCVGPNTLTNPLDATTMNLSQSPGTIHVEYYPEADLFQLLLPVSF